tara:strand:+ start:2326 stop:2694 length:369 start_codon:yes stop_codon:yes gene_type:complete
MASLKSLLYKLPGFSKLPGKGAVFKLLSLAVILVVLYYVVTFVTKFLNNKEGFEYDGSDDPDFTPEPTGEDEENEEEEEYELMNTQPVTNELVGAEGMKNKKKKSKSLVENAFAKAFKKFSK